MSNEYPSRDRIAIPSTGNAEDDAAEIDRFILHEKRMIEGICPNDCGPMVIDAPNDRTCPKCGFHQWSNVGFGKDY